MDATADPRETVRHGEHLYVMKPTMKSSKKSEGKGTWSDDEYAHPGLQVASSPVEPSRTRRPLSYAWLTTHGSALTSHCGRPP